VLGDVIDLANPAGGAALVPMVLGVAGVVLMALLTGSSRNDDDDSSPGGGIMQPVA
jgi:hypothetical protein